MVVAFHICEPHSTSHLDQVINHGYLAVDFFFVLSGFVVGYAYDDRWSRMTIGNFFKRRLIRLQPMVIMGMIVGAICFYFQASTVAPLIKVTPVWQMLLITLIGCTMIPVPVSMDIRGWKEMYPLNGPAWSLFFEYIVNILYAIVIRRLSKTILAILVFLAAAALVYLTVMGKTGDVVGGWSLETGQLQIGFTRVMYPFFAGLLLCRAAKLTHIRHAFLLCGILIVAVLSIPRIGGSETVWFNGIYESICIIFVFPLIVYLGASGEMQNGRISRICKFFGDISYPLYITHYPLIYIYIGWVIDNNLSLREALPMGVLTFLSAIILAYLCLRLYDLPLRSWLQKKLLKNERL